jgi:hypothetical protein
MIRQNITRLMQFLVVVVTSSVQSLIYEPNHYFFKTENSKVNMTYKYILLAGNPALCAGMEVRFVIVQNEI